MQDLKFNTDELNRIMAADIDKLTPNELKLRLKALEEKIRLAPIPADIKANTDLSGLGPEDLVVITMVAGPMGDIFNFSGTSYPPGRHTVKKRIAESLQYYVSEAYKIEREKLMSRSNINQSAMLRGEDLARVERFQQIMKED